MNSESRQGKIGGYRVAWDLSAFDDLYSGVVKRALKLIMAMLEEPEHPQFLIIAKPRMKQVFESYFAEAPSPVLCLGMEASGHDAKERMSPAWQQGFRALIEKHKIDWVHQDSRPITVPEKTIHTVHDLRDQDRRFRRSLFRSWWLRLRGPKQWQSCARVLAVSEFTLASLTKLWPAAEQEVAVIQNGVDRQDYEHIYAARSGRVMGAERRILILGHIEKRKNTKLMAAIIAELRRIDEEGNQSLDSWHIHFVGREVNDIESPSISQMTCHGLADADAMAKLMIETDLLLAPALYEGFGMVPLEAIAAGVPVLVSDIEAHREVLGQQDFLLDPLDVEAWIKAIINPPRYGAEFREALLKRYRWEHPAKKLLLIYRDLIAAESST